jgi:hypothetical protein
MTIAPDAFATFTLARSEGLRFNGSPRIFRRS